MFLVVQEGWCFLYFKCANSCSNWKQENVALVKTNINFIIESAGQLFSL